jgi:hypothetical protein
MGLLLFAFCQLKLYRDRNRDVSAHARIVGLDASAADAWLYACGLSIAKNAPVTAETAIAEMIAIACSFLLEKLSIVTIPIADRLFNE